MTAREPRVWDFDDDDFYEIEVRRDQIEFLLRYAVLAPSTHNSQPWSFRIEPEGVAIFPDESRALPVADSEQRELFMSLGAAIANLRVAAAHFGSSSTLAFPACPAEGEWSAFVSLTETCAPDMRLASLFDAIRRRRTNRRSFSAQPIEPDALAPILDCVEEFADVFSVVFAHDQTRMADLVAFADKVQMQDDQYRAELSHWTRSQADAANDGLLAESIGFPRAVAGAAPFILRHVDLGALQAYRDHDLAASAACLIVVSAFDDRVSLVNAGESLELLLLTITRSGLQYSFLNAPVQLPDMRERVATVTGARRPPQLILRIGPGQPIVHPTPRRPIHEVVQA
ncbi:MAG: hypothetical protein ABIO78_01475 [Thermoanaerobaculia bacterium]